MSLSEGIRLARGSYEVPDKPILFGPGYYRINIIPCWKPWRGNSERLTIDKAVFDVFSQEGMLDEMEFPGQDTEDEDSNIYDWLHVNTIDIFYPCTILDEVTVYTE